MVLDTLCNWQLLFGRALRGMFKGTARRHITETRLTDMLSPPAAAVCSN